MIGFMVLKGLEKGGGKGVIIVGGGSGGIGEGGGRREGEVLRGEELGEKEKGMRGEVRKVFGDDDRGIVNKNDWVGKLRLREFLGDYGKLL